MTALNASLTVLFVSLTVLSASLSRSAAMDSGSELRLEGLVAGVGSRSGRWETVQVAIALTGDMEHEADFISAFVLPAIRARLRTRQVQINGQDSHMSRETSRRK